MEEPVYNVLKTSFRKLWKLQGSSRFFSPITTDAYKRCI